MSSAATVDAVGIEKHQLPAARRPSGAIARRWSRRVAMDLVAMADALAVVTGCLLPAAIYATYGHVAVDWLAVVRVGLLAAIVVLLCLRAWGHYDPDRMRLCAERPLQMLAALVLACLAIMGLGLPIPAGQPHAMVWYATWILLSFALMLLIHGFAGQLLTRLVSAGHFDVRLAVYGAGAVARQVHDHLDQGLDGIHFVGVFDDRSSPGRLNTDGLCVSGSLEDLVALGRDDAIDRVIIALPASASDRILAVARKLEQLPVSLHVVTHVTSDLIKSGPALAVSAVGPIGLLDIKRKPLADWDPLIKRLEDVVLAGLLLMLSLPLLALIAIAVKLDSRGPVLFIQNRRGLNQRIISVLKFRTMSVLENGPDVRQATTGDRRITRVGRFLRRSSLDELPQLVNVLRGEMSLVGPRPHAIVHDEHYGAVVDGYVNRHQVKPGITGLAQVRGFRGETRTDDKMKDRIDCDLAYINAWSLWLDLRILLATIRAVVCARNAH